MTYPSEINITIGDKTTKCIKNKRNVAQKLLSWKTKETRHILEPQWNVLQHGTTTGCSFHIITIDTPLRKKHGYKKRHSPQRNQAQDKLLQPNLKRCIANSRRKHILPTKGHENKEVQRTTVALFSTKDHIPQRHQHYKHRKKDHRHEQPQSQS